MNSVNKKKLTIELSEPRLFPDRRFTYANYRNWPDDERWEIIHGHAFDITDPPGLHHQQVLLDLLGTLHPFFPGFQSGLMHGPFDVLLTKDGGPVDAVENIVQPDLMITLFPEKFTDLFFRGVPDFIAEIICPFRPFHDLGTKINLYEELGVPELWLLHPTEGWLLRHILSKGGRYSRGTFFQRGDRLSSAVLNDCKVDLSLVFSPRAPRSVRLKTEFLRH